MLLVATSAIFGQEAKPVWELGKHPFDTKMTKGKVVIKKGTVKLDGTNSFSLPTNVLGTQNDFTIEFEVKPPPAARSGHNIILVSNTDEKKKTGIKLQYCPPGYDCGRLFTNGNLTVEYRNFLRKKTHKITIVAKDKQLMMFRDGMLLASTGDFKPSKRRLTFGSVEKKSTKPYVLSNIRIYSQTVMPDGAKKYGNRMAYYSGDQYFMQRVKLKNPKLPRILIIGDSISGGYRRFITEHYRGKANVDYWLIGFKYMGGENSPMERALRGVLSNGPYNAVTFNFGLHYWTHKGRLPQDKLVPWMTKIVKLMKHESPKTAFIWLRTTPWRTTPKSGRPTLNNKKNDLIVKYNAIVDKVMRQNGVAIVDLYSFCKTKLDTVRPGSRDALHWSAPVSKLMADKIIKEIDKKSHN